MLIPDRKLAGNLRSASPISQRGVSIIELMIGIAVSLVIMAGVITVVINISVSGTSTIRTTRLNQELRSTLDLIGREVQKAGYVNPWDDSDPTDPRIDEDLIEAFGNVTVANSDGSACAVGDVCDCILYSYDLNDDAVPDGDSGPDNNEYFGFRHDAANGRVEMKVGGTNPTSCNAGLWQDFTDPEVNVTAFSVQFAVNDASGNNDGAFYQIRDSSGNLSATQGQTDAVCGTGATCLFRRKVNIVLDGQLASDAIVTTNLRSEVKILNDRYYTK